MGRGTAEGGGGAGRGTRQAPPPLASRAVPLPMKLRFTGRNESGGSPRGVEGDRRGVGDVETLHLAADRELGEGIAMRGGVLTHAFALGAQHQGNALRAQGSLQIRVGVAGEADAPEAGL